MTRDELWDVILDYALERARPAAVDAALDAYAAQQRREALLGAADQCDKNWQEINARDARDRDTYDSGAMDAWDIAEQMLRARAGEQG